MSEFLQRLNAFMPYQDWRPFPDDAIVQVKNNCGHSTIGLSKDFWWGFEYDFDGVAEGVIMEARRLDRKREHPNP